MIHPVTININALTGDIAAKKKEALEVLANKMDADNLKFLANLATTPNINNKIRTHGTTLELALEKL